MVRALVACIVEGHGEVEAVPILIRRIAAVLDLDQDAMPIRSTNSTVISRACLLLWHEM